MNKIDRRWYRLLKDLSKIPTHELYAKYKTKYSKRYGSGQEALSTWNELHELGHINTNPEAKQIITKTGIEQLRMLEDIRRKNSTLIISIIAIILSIGSILISIFFN